MRSLVAALVLVCVGCPGGGSNAAAPPADGAPAAEGSTEAEPPNEEADGLGVEVECFECGEVVDYGEAVREYITYETDLSDPQRQVIDRMMASRKAQGIPHLLCSDACNSALLDRGVEAYENEAKVCDMCGGETSLRDAVWSSGGGYCSKQCRDDYRDAYTAVKCSAEACRRTVIPATHAVFTGQFDDLLCREHR